MKVIELFAGIGACSKALERLGYDIEIVDAVEIDKYAIKSFNAIHGTDFEVQDITKWDKDFKDIDLITHGSPCQDFSVAGKQAGGDIGSGTRSSLMYETIRIVGKIRPKYVLWENVKNLLSKKHIHNFNAYIETMKNLGYTSYYQVLNAKDYGIPQNRERVYTVSIRNDITQNYKFPIVEELKKMPIDFLEDKVDEKYYLTESNIKNYNREFGSKGKELDLKKPVPTLVASMGTGGGNVPYFEFPQKEELKLKLKDILEDEVDEKYYLDDEKIKKITNSNFMQEKKRIQEKDYCDTILARDWKDPKCIQISNKALQETLEKNKLKKDVNFIDSYNRNVREDDLAGTITTRVSASNNTFLGITNKCIQVGELDMKGYEQMKRFYSPQCNDSMECVNNLRIRKLTPKECWRLMGFDDEDFEKAEKVNSNSQLYKQAGNSIVVNVLEKIFKNLFKEER